MTILVSLMTFACAVSCFAEFKDVSAENAELTHATNLLSALGIINGYEDGSLKLEKDVSRAEMAKMLITALGYGEIINDTPKFADCQRHWAGGYISLANDLGIIDGVGNNKFAPDSTVTYEQATVMLLRTLGYTNENLTVRESTAYNAAAYRTKALDLGLLAPLTTDDGKASANRGDVALMLNVNLQQSMVQTDASGKPEVITDQSGEPVILISKVTTQISGKITKIADGYIYIDGEPYKASFDAVVGEEGTFDIVGDTCVGRNASTPKTTPVADDDDDDDSPTDRPIRNWPKKEPAGEPEDAPQDNMPQ